MARLEFEIVPVTPLEQNCTLLWDGATRDAVVIDPGGDVAKIAARIDALGLRCGRILLTHGHVDHAAGATELAGRLSVPIEGPHVADRFLCERLAEQGAAFGLPARDVTPDRWLEAGGTIEVGGLVLDVLHVPGHSPGHVAFVARDRSWAQIGDTLFAGSIGRTDLPGGDLATLLASIRERLLPLGDALGFVCGHGPQSTIGRERRTNPFLVADPARR